MPAADGTGIRLLLCEKVLGQGIAPLHGPQKLCAGELIPGGCDNGGALILLPQQSNGGLQCSGFQLLRAAEDDGPGVLHLVGVELAKVFQVDLRFGRIGHGNRAAQRHLRDLLRHILNSPDYIGQLAYAGRFNENAVRMKLLHDFFQRLAKVAHQGAADAPGIHLGDFHPCILQKAAVDADLAELILNEDNSFALQSFIQQFFDESGFSGAQKAGDYVYFCHRGYASF